MIKINLLPQEMKKEESVLSNIKAGISIEAVPIKKIAVSVVALLILVHGSLFVIGAIEANRSGFLTNKLNKLLPQKKEYAALKQEVDLSNKKAKAIDDLMANRFSWAEKLNGLSDSVTQGVWLTGLSYDESVIKDMSESAKQPKQRRAEPRTTLAKHLVLTGYASSMGEQGTLLIGKFIQGMKDNRQFSSDFGEIKLESIKSDKVQDQEVMNFKITCAFK